MGATLQDHGAEETRLAASASSKGRSNRSIEPRGHIANPRHDACKQERYRNGNANPNHKIRHLYLP
jgi:hypothetical protein